MVVVRQIIALSENVRLYKEAQADIRERELAQAEVIGLNEELEGRVAQRTEELETANRELKSEVQERTQAEAAMLDSERRMADIINFLPDATFVINKQAAVIAWNRAIEKMTGIRAGDILGKDNRVFSAFLLRAKANIDRYVLNQDLEVEKAYEMVKRHYDGTLVGVCFVSNMMSESVYLMGAQPFSTIQRERSTAPSNQSGTSQNKRWQKKI